MARVFIISTKIAEAWRTRKDKSIEVWLDGSEGAFRYLEDGIADAALDSFDEDGLVKQ
jgi:hypothetical protein